MSNQRVERFFARGGQTIRLPVTLGMKTMIRTRPALLAFLLSMAATAQAQHDISEYLVIIDTDVGSGSGFVCSLDGTNFVITNTHVLEAARTFTFRTVNRGNLKPVRLELANDRDLARVQIENEEQPALAVGTGSPRLSQPVRVYGNSDGAGVVTEISGRILGIGPSELEVDAAFVSGNSGSPILSPTREVLGVATYLTRPGITNWITANTRFGGTRRFGTRITRDIEWIAISPSRLYQESRLLADCDTYLSDCFDILSALNGKDIKAFEVISARQGGSKSTRYYDRAYPKLIQSLCDGLTSAVANYSRGMSDRSFSVTMPFRNAQSAFLQLPKQPLNDLRRMSWSTTRHRQIATEYYKIFNDWDDVTQ